VISLEREGPVFVLRMQGGENRIDADFVEEWGRALDEVEASQGEAALVSTGEGRYYSTGLDLEWLAGPGAGRANELLDALHRLFARLLTFPMATVAAVNGHAFAAGAMLALVHDFRLMREDRGYLCLPEVDLRTGRPLTPGMYALLRARLTPDVLHEALITGRRYAAAEAVEHEMVHEACPDDRVLSRAIELARSLAGKHRPTLAALKRGLFERELAELRRPVELDV